MESIHTGKATSFADPADLTAYNKAVFNYVKNGYTLAAAKKKAYGIGDNGVGYWDDPTVAGSGPSCALPPETMEERWSDWHLAHLKRVKVEFRDKTVVCLVKDRMPHRANITNHAIMDLNFDAWQALGMMPPCSEVITWSWWTE